MRNCLKVYLGLFGLILFVGCAKELPEYLSDDLQKNVFEISQFEGSVIVETFSQDKSGRGTLSINTVEVLSQAFALNEKELYPVRFISGDERLRPFVEGLELEANGPREQFKISFKLTENYLVGYKEANGNLSGHLEMIRRGHQTPIFQYPLSNYGVLERRENDLGEETRVVEFRTRHRTNSTHVRINSTVENRTYAGLRARDYNSKEVVMLKDQIDGKVINGHILFQLLKNNNAIHRTSGLKSNDPVRLKAYRGRLYIQIPTDYNNLTEVERGYLRSGDNRIEECGKKVQKQLGFSHCIYRPAYSVNIDHITFRRQTDRNEAIAAIDIHTDINPEDTPFIRINLDQEITRDELGQDFSLVDQTILLKDDIDLEATYLYVPITMGTPRDVRVARPFFQGSEKLVQLQWRENALEVLEVERDERFQTNVLNNKPVIRIPGHHIDFRCRQNNNNECIGGDEVDNDKTWQERNFFLADMDRLEVLEINMLDLMTNNSPCLFNVSSEMVDYTAKNGVLNIQIEKTYRTANDFGRCLWEHYSEDPHGLSGLSNTTFKTQFHYSLVNIEKLRTEGYQPIAYPTHDQSEFGFFRTYEQRLGLDFDRTRQNRVELLNRWAGSGDPNNPRVINYYLNDSYFKPENQVYLKYTQLAEVIINDALKQAGADIKINFDDQTRGKTPGDLRNNMLILIDDPLANGLLGYAPTITDPDTGEILQGQINMYSAVIESMVRRQWQAMVDHQARQLKIDAKDRLIAVHHPLLLEKSRQNIVLEERDDDIFYEEGLEQGYQEHFLQINNITNVQKKFEKLSQLKAKETARGREIDHNFERKAQRARQMTLERLRRQRSPISPNDLSHLSEVEKLIHTKEERLDIFAQNSAYAEEFLQIGGIAKEIPVQVQNNDEFHRTINGQRLLKEWDDLSKDEQKLAIRIISPISYLTVFIHEMGHNLGLRHNFTGSYDRDNFYTEDEIRQTERRLIRAWLEKNNCAENMATEKCSPSFYERAFSLKNGFAYSSIMDYSASSMNELTIFGKYDIAALRFAYARKIESESGELISIKDTLEKEYKRLEAKGVSLRDYRFCTDQNAGLSVTCNRFQEGTSLVEIVQHYIQNYNDAYLYRNFRDGRNNFTEFGLLGYTAARLREFRNMRNIFEEWERFADIFGDQLLTQGCGPTMTQNPSTRTMCKMINDRTEAVKLLANFYLEILKTPDHLCAIASEENPEQTIEFAKLSELYLKGRNGGALRWQIDYVPHSCFDPAIEELFSNEGLIVRGEAGKFLNGFKDNNPNFPYASDRYARGIWVDKAVAMKSLFQRDSEMPTTDENFRALVDLPEVKSEVTNFVISILFNQEIENGVLFRKNDGTLYQESYTMGLDDIVQGPPRQLQVIRDLFAMPRQGNEYLNAILLNIPTAYGLTTDFRTREASRNFVNQFTVRVDGPFSYFRHDENNPMREIQIDDKIYRASPQNQMAYLMMEMIQARSLLINAQIEDPDMITRVLERRTTSPEAPEGLDRYEQIVWTMPEEFLTQLASLPTDVKIPVESFIEAFGEHNGQIVYTLYLNVGPLRAREIVEQKAALQNTPPEEASEIERKLYDLSLHNLYYFQAGKLNDEMVENLIENLKLLPEHVQ